MPLMRYRPLGSAPQDSRLGRFIPDDDEHIRKYPYTTVAEKVEHINGLPSWHWTHDQGAEGSCVGHGSAMERAVMNTRQNRVLRVLLPTRRYDPISLWNEAKINDEWADTNPGDDNGT